MLNYIFSIICIYVFFGFLLYLFQRKILFNVSGPPNKPIDYGLNTVKEIHIPTSDNLSLLAWYSEPKINQPTMVYFHGNSYNIGERSNRIDRYIKMGWGVLLVAWRGYSGNKGKPNEKNMYIDAESTLLWLANNTSTEKKEIVLYGESLGTGVAVEIGTRYQFKSVILEAPFTSIFDIAQQRYKIYPAKFLTLDKFNNYNKIDKILSPLLIISGKNDEIVPHNHSLKLYSKAIESKHSVFIDEAMHNNLYDFGIEKEVLKFNI